ncbi:MAG TPA: DoxX family protein [Xanthobacteraceae bacterium]|nr:DoxX family protein [Xanthobacteraceae bacterium]
MHILFAIARVLLVLIFVLSGAMKLLDIPATAAQIQPVVTIPDMLKDFVAQVEAVTGMNWPSLLAVLAGVVEVVAALLIAFNIGTRGAAAVLAIFTLVATFYFHAFWNMSGELMQTNMIHALKNLSIIGGLLVMVVLGSWRPLRSNEI